MKEKGKITTTTAALVLLLLTLGAEAELCEKIFYTRCLYDQDCIGFCVSKGYTNGQCRGWQRPSNSYCVCTKECPDGGKSPPPKDEPAAALTLRARKDGSEAIHEHI
ncbi:unnamed protein product [Urochloa decumbens]|uniref:Knottin scorpion toxin-like domain-containing protein n=1 Tax=Urochloa decumbens TaxID=240449 RepID=A0ABC9BX04_9POAL